MLATPDYIGQRLGRDHRRVEFVRLVGRPSRWLLVSVKFLDEKQEARVNSAHPVADGYLTRLSRRADMVHMTVPLLKGPFIVDRHASCVRGLARRNS